MMTCGVSPKIVWICLMLAPTVSPTVSVSVIGTPKVTVPPGASVRLYDSFVAETVAPDWVTVASHASGTFWFFDASNVELLLKVVDGCALNDRLWVFFAATTDVSLHVEVTDTRSGVTREYTNPLGLAAKTVTDTQSFATCH